MDNGLSPTDARPEPGPPSGTAPQASPAERTGAALKKARSLRGDSLEAVCQHTRIPKKYLQALEDGRFDEMPAPVYLRSFLRDYCEHLDLDFEPLWEALHPPAPASADAPAPGAAAGAAPASSPAAPGRAETGRPALSPLDRSPHLAALVSSGGAVLLTLGLAAALAIWIMRERPAAPDEPDSQHPAALLPLRLAVEPRLAIVLREEAWISVRADGELVFAGRAPKNARQEWRARKILRLRTPAPESLELTLNGAPYRLPQPEADGEYRIESP